MISDDDLRENARLFFAHSDKGFTSHDVGVLACLLRETAAEAVEADRKARRKMPEGCPVTLDRLDEMREAVASGVRPDGMARFGDDQAIMEDQRVALDHALESYDVLERECAAIASDRECDSRMTEAGVAKAILTLRRLQREAEARPERDQIKNACGVLAGAAVAIEMEHVGAEAEPLPHDRTIAERKRYEDALRKISRLLTRGETSVHDDMVEATLIAREALRESANG